MIPASRKPPGDPAIPDVPSQFTDIVAVIGLPRSGTTLAASLFDAHPGCVVCYEPWNRDREHRVSAEQTPAQLAEKFALDTPADARVFVVKETTVDFHGIEWLKQFLVHNAATHRVRVAWTLRAYRHTYLSFVEGARQWWGHDDMTIDPEGYSRWAKRARLATRTLLDLYQQFPGVLYAYEALVASPAEVLPVVMKALGLSYDPRQLDYMSHIAREQVRGDIGLSEDPRPVSTASMERREAEWQGHAATLAGAEGDALRVALDGFWASVRERVTLAGGVPPALLPGILTEPLPAGGAGHEYRQEFASRDEWQAFARANPAILDGAAIDRAAEAIARRGFQFRGQPVAADEVRSSGHNYRESFVHNGLNARKRAVLVELYADLRQRPLTAATARVYAPESLGGFADFLAGEFAHFEGSEYLPDAAERDRRPELNHQDLAALSFPDACFDYVLVNDIFEHVPDLEAVLSEIQRVLAPGGVLLSTFPFAIKREEHLVRAELLEDGTVRHLMEPEYHEDPVNPEGVLVFQLPGWQVLKQCRQLGFGEARMVFLSSPARGVLANNISGVLLLKASNPA
jgi:SAM-dependent methyltransferase